MIWRLILLIFSIRYFIFSSIWLSLFCHFIPGDGHYFVFSVTDTVFKLLSLIMTGHCIFFNSLIFICMDSLTSWISSFFSYLNCSSIDCLIFVFIAWFIAGSSSLMIVEALFELDNLVGLVTLLTKACELV